MNEERKTWLVFTINALYQEVPGIKMKISEATKTHIEEFIESLEMQYPDLEFGYREFTKK